MDDAPHSLMFDLPTYRSRVVPVPARYAPVVFERWWCDARRRAGWTGAQVVATDDGRLVLDPLTWTRSGGPSALQPYRSVIGTAHVGRGRGLRNELAAGPWSKQQDELRLRVE